MTMMRDPDREIRAFLDEGRTELPDRTYDAIRARIERTHQRAVFGPWRGRRLPGAARFGIAATAATAAVIVGAIGLTLTGGGRPSSAVASQVGLEWVVDDQLAFTVRRDPTDDRAYYWRVATYDQIGVRGWSIGPTTTTDRPAGARILDQQADDVDPIGRQRVTFTVIPGGFAAATMISPVTPIEADVPTRLSVVGKEGRFATLTRDGDGPYTVTALVAVPGDGAGQLNDRTLAATGSTYPTDIKELYLDVPQGALGPNARALRDKILARAGSNVPIALVEAIMAELRSVTYTYATDLRDLRCEGLSTVECFATFRRGFCQYYASTMALILRDLGVPTRIVEGFLPGSRDGTTEIIRNSSAHAWVEVYFPDVGWVTFDPTAGNLPGQLPASLPSGSPSGTATP